MTDAASQDGNAAQIAYWNDRAAVTWTAFQTHLDAVFAPLTAIAVKAAAPAPNEHVIDIGCGCGATVLELARRVGPSGDVLGVDVSEPMAARARERIASENLANAHVLVSDAATHDFPPGGADLLFSRFGVMFFTDPTAAFANLRRAMRPGGRLLFACWRPLADNAWFSLPLDAALALLPPQPPFDPHAPGPYAFADAERVRGILTTAGWRDPDAVRHDVPMRLSGPGERDKATEFATRVGPLARLLAEADPDLRAAACQAVATALSPHDGVDGITLQGSIWLVSARA
ncbi:class I SAM-dependent methyltransferase [Rhodopila sp.]|uniref:class I SAM-dependent methyltransferase n=1 Tax=Rhodopila sp. TaxID=2480087 RepID=UPI003D0DC48E